MAPLVDHDIRRNVEAFGLTDAVINVNIYFIIVDLSNAYYAITYFRGAMLHSNIKKCFERFKSNMFANFY